MKKNVKFIVAGFVIFVAMAYYVSVRVYSMYGNSIVVVSVENHKLYAERVASGEKLKKGLGGRSGLCSSCGMLFEFQKSGKYSFWMKDMRFPLDLVWIFQGKVVHIEKNIQPTLVGSLLPLEDADMVLEINAGSADKFKIKIGDVISF